MHERLEELVGDPARRLLARRELALLGHRALHLAELLVGELLALEHVLGLLGELAVHAQVLPQDRLHVEPRLLRVGPLDVPDLIPPPFTIFTSMFIHGDVLHLGGNLWFLWLFGSKVEGLVGARRFLVHYFTAGLAAALLQVIALPDNTMPMIGASGAIAGVLGAYALAFPRQPIRCLVFVVFFVTFVSLPSSLLLALWFLAQFVSAGGKTPGVAWFP